uniref:Uncharacterized protein n=1 Tax=Phakopsora pachyrhizi TaxID=170000 RepID=A0A0S1MJZ1_PHAPC
MFLSFFYYCLFVLLSYHSLVLAVHYISCPDKSDQPSRKNPFLTN